MANDESVPKIASNLVYVVRANLPDQVESKVIYSIFQKQPKRANTYWLVHVDRTDEPDTFEYKVTHIIPDILIRVDFYLGFKVEPKINLYFKEVLDDLVQSGELKLVSGFDSLRKHGLSSDFLFVLIDRVMIRDNQLSTNENVTLALHNISRLFCISDVNALQLDGTITIEEKVPITINQPVYARIVRTSGGK
jgi:KUP system potassium uptake protein